MQCRKALEEASGDMDKAMIILQKKGAEIAGKKADRSTADGLVAIKSDGKRAVTLILNCETDFVARNNDFTALANNLLQIAWNDGVQAARAQAPGLINDVVLKIGENIVLGDIEEIGGDVVGSYTHHTGKIAAVVVLTAGTPEIAKDIAMHATAMRPRYTTTAEIKDSERASVMEVFKEEVAGSDKPEDIKAKMLESKMTSYFKEQTLTEQPFFKMPEKTIKEYAAANGASVEKYVLYTISI